MKDNRKRKEDTYVRLSEEAHALLAEKAKNLGESMKEVASEAVISLFKRELKYNEYYIAHLKRLQEKIKSLQKHATYYILFGVGLGLFIAFVIIILAMVL